MTKSCIFLAALAAFTVAGCVASPEAPMETASAAVRPADVGFFLRTPLSDPSVDALRSALEDTSGYAWAQNQGRTLGVAWTHGPGRPLDAGHRTAIAQAAFSFAVGEHRDLLRDLEVVPGTDLGQGLDAIGLFPDGPDSATAAARSRLEGVLRGAAAEHGVTVLRARLTYEPDMSWEGALVVVDEAHGQILFATGGWGT